MKKVKYVVLGLGFLLKLSQSALAQEGTNYTHGDWRVFCPTAEQNRPCIMNQRGIDENNQNELYQVGLLYSGNAELPLLEVMVPLGVYIEPGLVINIGDNQLSLKLTYKQCINTGCFASGLLDAEAISKFEGNIVGQLTYVSSVGQSVTLPFSLNGFTAAHGRIKPMK